MEIKKHQFLIIAATAMMVLSGCNKQVENFADLVVYGKNIYTANENADFVEAFAVKNGKYIAVGSKKEMEKFINNSTIIKNAEFVMPGATESHGHWILEQAFKMGCYTPSVKGDGSPRTLEDIIQDVKTYQNDHPGISAIFGYGWSFTKQGFPTLELIDQAFPDIPVFIAEDSLHGAWLNTACFHAAGIYDQDPEGVPILRDENGNFLGIAMDETISYIRNKVFGELLDDEQYKEAVVKTARYLNSLGYTAHYDTWSNFDGTSKMYEAISNADKDSKNPLNFLFASSYCINSYEKDKASQMIQEAVQLKNKYTSNHYKPSYIKLFADGVCEGGTGYVSQEYKTKEFGHGTRIWEPSTMNSIVSESNRNGLKVHIHTMGDKAVSEAVDAFIASTEENGYYRNSIAHVALCSQEDYLRIKKYNISVSSGANWASQLTQEEIDAFTENFLDEETYRSMYPYQEYVNYGIKAALHTDNPCSPGILDLFGYIQVLVDGYDHSKAITPESAPRRNKFITVRDAIDMFTINGAWMNNLENERGSIEVGKYADFIFSDQDPFKVNNSDVWKITLTNTFFEGNEVYNYEENI